MDIISIWIGEKALFEATVGIRGRELDLLKPVNKLQNNLLNSAENKVLYISYLLQTRLSKHPTFAH
jgi:hypothetical protein